MVMDFGDLKRIVNNVIIDRYDHAFIVRATQANEKLCQEMRDHYKKIERVDYQPTCENMISYFAEAISEQLPSSVELVELKLYETASSCAQWCALDNKK
jgi:6-pyruvoyltetrahydropterin/6-carboxytetrahydropterin synthase